MKVNTSDSWTNKRKLNAKLQWLLDNFGAHCQSALNSVLFVHAGMRLKKAMVRKTHHGMMWDSYHSGDCFSPYNVAALYTYREADLPRRSSILKPRMQW